MEMADELGVGGIDVDILGGCRVIGGMAPYAQRYGGHQFGNWAGPFVWHTFQVQLIGWWPRRRVTRRARHAMKGTTRAETRAT